MGSEARIIDGMIGVGGLVLFLFKHAYCTVSVPVELINKEPATKPKKVPFFRFSGARQ